MGWDLECGWRVKYSLQPFPSSNCKVKTKVSSQKLPFAKEPGPQAASEQGSTVIVGLQFSQVHTGVQHARAMSSRIELGRGISDCRNPYVCLFWLLLAACGILVPQPGIKPVPLVVETQESYPLDHQGSSRSPFVLFCLVAKLCLTLCDPMDWSPVGSSVRGIFQARILEWVAISRKTKVLKTPKLPKLFFLGYQCDLFWSFL